MNLKYTFSAREKVLLVILGLVLVLVVWYMMIFTPSSAAVAEAQAAEADVQMEIDTTQLKLSKMTSMQAEIDRVFAEADGDPVPMSSYDNIRNVVNELDVILAAANAYKLDFAEIRISEDGIVRRGVNLTFGCADYQTAKDIVVALEKSNYRCEIDSLTISQSNVDRGTATNDIILNKSDRGEGASSSSVSVSAHLTYFETSKK